MTFENVNCVNCVNCVEVICDELRAPEARMGKSQQPSFKISTRMTLYSTKILIAFVIMSLVFVILNSFSSAPGLISL